MVEKTVIVDRDIKPDNELHPLSFRYLVIWLEYLLTPVEKRGKMSFEEWLDSLSDFLR